MTKICSNFDEKCKPEFNFNGPLNKYDGQNCILYFAFRPSGFFLGEKVSLYPSESNLSPC